MKYSKIPTMRVLIVLLFVALCTPSVFAQRQNIRAGNGMKETRDSVLRLHIDSVKIRNEIRDSIAAHPGGADGRAYVRGANMDSTGALYTINFVQDYTSQINFSNGTSAGDSVQFVFASSTGLLLPVAAGRRATFDICLLKTNYTGGSGSYVQLSFPAHVLGSSDTAFVSVHLVATGTSPRRYWIRLYKSKQADLSGLAPNLVDATKVYLTGVEIDPLTIGYLPPTNTSVQVRITLRVKWTP